MITPAFEVLKWVGDSETGFLRLLDQTKLPTEVCDLDCRTLEQTWDAIKRLVVRGAPAIGVAAGYGMVIAAQIIAETEDFTTRLCELGEYLNSSRPTAVNLSWAIDKVCAHAKTLSAELTLGQKRDKILALAREIHLEDQQMCMQIGLNASPLIEKCASVLTHCNAGALATAGIGTATAGMYVAHSRGHKFSVYCDETRPLLQGSRLTAWELSQSGIDARVITDNMAGWVLKQGMVDMIITGADRIAANGDSANKIGTYSLAVLAARHNVPFYIAAPYSTFDLNCPTGEDIPIELRAGDEIINGFGKQTAPTGIATYCPAFDVTPAELIAGLITDKGIISDITPEGIAKFFARN